MDVTPQCLPFGLTEPGADRLVGLLSRRFAQRQQPPGHDLIHGQHSVQTRGILLTILRAQKTAPPKPAKRKPLTTPGD